MRRTLIGALALLLGVGNAAALQRRGVTFIEAIQDRDTLGSASAVAVSPDGAHVYTAAPGSRSHTLVAFARDSLTGLLTQVDVERNGVDGVEGLDSPAAIAMSPDGAHVYVASIDDNAVAVFARDPGTGAVEFVEAVQILDPEGIAVSPDGAQVYVASFSSDTIAIYTRDPDTGRLELNDSVTDGIGGVDGLDGVFNLTLSPDGRHVYATGIRDTAVATFARDTVFGTLQFVEAKQGIPLPDAVIVSPDGAHAYVLAGADVIAFARDATSGTLTEIERDEVAGIDGTSSLAVSPDGTLVYAVGGLETSGLAVFARDPGTGRLSFIEAEVDGVNGVEGLFLPTSVAPSPDGRHVYVTAQGPGTLVTFAVDGAVATTTTTTTTTSTTLNACGSQPLAGCRFCGFDLDKTTLLLKNLPDDRKDQLTFKCVGTAADVADFGDPLTATDYTFCLYDRNGLVLSAAAPAGRLCDGKPCWSARRDGFRYRDGDKGLDGLAQVKLQADGDGNAKLAVTGKGPNLPVPSLPLVEDKLVAQLVAAGGVCFETPFDVTRNDGKVVETSVDD